MRAAPRPKKYDTHFYCALCGGPFAQVFRTAVQPSESPADAGPGLPETDPDDESLANEFNVPADENREIPEEVVLEQMGHAARRSRDLRARAEADGRRQGIVSEKRAVRMAYDGRRIATRQMKWLKNLRALVNRKAKNHPLGYQDFLEEGQIAYLTGRGLIRQHDNWADAFANIEVDEQEQLGEEEDEEDEEAGSMSTHTEYPMFSESALQKNTFGFHVYQELGRDGIEYFVSSIPFHDECWSLLDLAIETSGTERGLANMNEKISFDDLWGYLRCLVGVSGVHRVTEQTWGGSLNGNRRREVVTRLGEVDYRDAQGSGDGWQWKHQDGCHWLAADPSSISVLESPLKLLPATTSLPCAPRAALVDPFMNMPTEVILDICGLLSSTDIFSLKSASPAAMNVALPESYYRRFLREEFKYLPTLVKEIAHHERRLKRGKPNNVDWRGSFERLRRLMRTPKPSCRVVEDDDIDADSEWNDIDIGLKNRNRIWKIVKPMAEELVETSSAAIHARFGAHRQNAERTGVVRGYVGVRSGREGYIETAYFGCRGQRRARRGYPEDSDEEGEHHEDTIPVKVRRVRVWVDGSSGAFCGMAFRVRDAMLGDDWRQIGRRGSEYFDVPVSSRKLLAGFVFCLSGHIVSGIQITFEDHGQNSHISFSPRFGRWTGGVRKIIVPSYWRTLVGVTGYVNSSGFIETIGLLEETKIHDRQDDFGPLGTPPRTVDLSHEEASLWTRLPPENVSFLEREGLNVPDWRLCSADWEVWEPGYHEEGAPTRQTSAKHLSQIVGYYDEHFLRGLKFIYEDDNTVEKTISVVGCAEAAQQTSICFEKGETMLATVICFGIAGIHGVLFVTDRGRTSEVFGPRYKGTHKVFAPAPDLKSNGALSRTAHRHETMSKIIGLHCLYDHHAKRFLQLGLILPVEEDCIFNQPVPRPIPFDELDDQVAVWCDGPPPRDWIIGSPAGERVEMVVRRGPPFPDYTGWAEFAGVRRITVYGRMKGIRFSYHGQRVDKFFGNVENEYDTLVQDIDTEHGEKVIGAAILNDLDPLETMPVKDAELDDTASMDTKSSIEDEGPTGRLYFITNRNVDDEPPFPVQRCMVCPELQECLAAAKFDFSTDRLVSWTPIFMPTPRISRKTLFERVNFPWKHRPDNVEADCDIPESTVVACTFFDDSEDRGAVDAVKGYVTNEGRFCGLTFRRNRQWSEEVFGQRSSYETTMELLPGECFTSVCIPEINGKPSPEALALCTNLGNASPWFGISGRPNVPVKYRRPPPGHVAVGIFGALVERPYYFGSYLWNTVGILYRPQHAGDEPMLNAHVVKLQRPAQSAFQRTDHKTELPWMSDCSARAEQNLYLRPLLAERWKLYQERENFGRAYCIFDPSQLQQIRVYSNPIGGGIRSVRFRGTPEMGLVTIGEWPTEEVKLKSAQKMRIDGPGGERIVRMRVALQRLEHEDRIVGLMIDTSRERSKTFVSCSMYPEKPVDLNNVKLVECTAPDEAVVGLHGIVSGWNIHDLSFVVQMGTQTPTRAVPPLSPSASGSSQSSSALLQKQTEEDSQQAGGIQLRSRAVRRASLA